MLPRRDSEQNCMVASGDSTYSIGEFPTSMFFNIIFELTIFIKSTEGHNKLSFETICILHSPLGPVWLTVTVLLLELGNSELGQNKK